MALIRSTILSEIRGSINGTTFSRNRYGAYARNRTNPVNPNTVAQQNARAALANSSQAFSAIDPGELLLWQNYAVATPVVNRLGETITLSAIAWFNKLNGFRRFLGVATVTVPPELPGQAENIAVTGISIADSASGTPNAVSVNGYEMGSTNVGAFYAMWISGSVSQGVQYYNGPWTYLGHKLGTTRTDEYIVPWNISAGERYFTRIRYMDATGKLSKDFIEPNDAVNIP